MKTKINWGTAIVIVFIGFISFILFFVIKMNTNKKFEHDLVTEEYYKKELAFQQEIDAEKKGNDLINNIIIKQHQGGLIVTFPLDKNYSDISGTIYLYRPSDKKMDFSIPILLKTSEYLIPNDIIHKGRWDIIINWKYKNDTYLFKKSITY
ncbi:FixH family protein [Aquimarina pacifica]|uniref:FixH family protein n=1 Tax=Aquimarina pacifica TaxID=1296415 RepID=UPI00047136C2|nr:FixH family protein [Aquimarina pacifica]